jgi:formylglycine-generating enzyme required for sulfatase activity
VRGKLTAPLATIFQDKSRSESAHTLATDILADYAADNPDVLAELLMAAGPKAYETLFPVAQRQVERTLPVLRAEIVEKAEPTWNDAPLDPSWTQPAPDLKSWIESAQGLIAERFAFCQTMPIDEFVTTAEGLKRSGYRPVRCRPYADGPAGRVAAVWTRDRRSWRMASGLTVDEVRQQDERNRKDGFIPIDIAGYVVSPSDGKPVDRYAALWVERAGPDDEARMYVGTTTDDHQSVQDRLKEAKLIARTITAVRGTDGRVRFCGVWGRPPGAGVTGQGDRDLFEGTFEQDLANRGDQLLLDVAASAASQPRTIRERAQSALERADKTLKAKPDDPDARKARAMANLRLSETAKALGDFNTLVAKDKDDVDTLQYRTIALARLGKNPEALTELATFQKGDVPERSKLFLAAAVAAELGEGTEKALEALDTAIGKQPEGADLRYDAARAFSLASKPITRSGQEKSRKWADRALGLLQEAVKNGEADFGRIDDDPAFDPIRDSPGFVEVLKAGHPERRYAAVWSRDARFKAVPNYGLDPAAQLQRCRELASQGYRIVSLSVARTSTEGPPVTASIWHRPVITEQAKDQLAERQARAAITLVRMGKAAEVMPLLRHSADPRLRSFIVNWLNPLGADPKLIAAEFDRINPNPKPTPAPGQQKMDAILFHPETSMRRALILALGTFARDGLSPADREPLFGKLLDLYHNDPDSGIHGAAAWTLRRWGQQEKLQTADAELMKVKDRGDRRWYVNSQGQTFAVIEGPVEFRMGSPPTEPDRDPVESLHRLVIPRRFTIADREVTVEQYQRFVQSHPQFGVQRQYLNRYSPEGTVPMIGVSWYGAGAYCNWLSEQEKLPKDQWCYLPNPSGEYGARMSIPADALKRRGYRLPTEAEWEYACRAGAMTSRYYGSSKDLLDHYAWYIANSGDPGRAQACGELLPNDLGLFDMLGNVYEWCQDRTITQRGDSQPSIDDILDEIPRLLRGGSFVTRQEYVRSASRSWFGPTYRNTSNGFRPARTHH